MKDEQMDERLDPSTVQALWAEYKTKGSIAARDQIITNYLYLVKWAVNKLTAGFPAHVQFDDLYSPGVIGLIKAVDKFDPSLKNKFETYALLVIRGAILDEIRELDWVPRSVHKKANQVAQAQDELSQKLGREPTDQELAKHLKVDAEELEEMLAYIKPAVLIPLNAPQDEESEQATIAERIPDEKSPSSFDVADYNEFKKLLEDAIGGLPEQERIVLVLYYFENMMLKEIGQIINVSESRVSQIHTKALMRLRKRLESVKAEFADIF
ncbi:MAG: polymerase sigma factor, sigma-70 family [Chlamydiales bacterium]|jgi:RNA polymerase sigma factor for flagellar operon FliA|nr:polymerase sigma factor, sigma-70 family [Chlamydiales bacterium]